MASPVTVKLVKAPPVAHSSRWSLEGIRSALAGLLDGEFYRAAMLAEAMLGDDRILHCYQQIALEVTGRDLRFEPSKTGDGRTSKAWTREVESFYTSKTCTTPKTWDLVKWSELLGVAVGQVTVLVDGTPGRRRWIPVVNVLPPHHLRLNATGPSERWTYQTTTGPVEVTPGVNGWFLFLPRGPRGFVEAAIRALAHPWLARTFARRDFSRWAELFGNGMIKARHPKDAKDPVVRRWLEGVRNLGREPVIKLPEGYDVELVMSASSSADGFEKLLDHCDKAITLTMQGQTLTSDAGANGSRALGEVHRDTANLRTVGRVRGLEAFERETFLKPASDWNQGNPDAAPCIERDLDPPADEKASAEALGAFAEAVAKCVKVGIPIDLEELAEDYGVPLDQAIDVATRLLGELGPELAKCVTVDEWRERLGLEPLGDERGSKLIAEIGTGGGASSPSTGNAPPGSPPPPRSSGDQGAPPPDQGGSPADQGTPPPDPSAPSSDQPKAKTEVIAP